MKCRICGKSFKTLSALREHHNGSHHNQKFVPPRAKLTRSLLAVIIIILIAVSGVVGYLIYANASQKLTSSSTISRAPIAPALYQNLTSVSDSTLAQIGPNQSGVTAPSSIAEGEQLLGPNNKPEILFIGAEWCPYCAAERWSLVVALSKFGNFSKLGYMESAADDGNISTVTFLNATFTSQYVSFVSVEVQDRNHNSLQSTTPLEQDLWGAYTSDADNFPFVYIYGYYYLSGAQYSPASLEGLSWNQIGSQLNDPQSSVSKLIDGAANQIIGAVCTALRNRLWSTPSICLQSFAKLSFSEGSNGASSYEIMFVASLDLASNDFRIDLVPIRPQPLLANRCIVFVSDNFEHV